MRVALILLAGVILLGMNCKKNIINHEQKNFSKKTSTDLHADISDTLYADINCDNISDLVYGYIDSSDFILRVVLGPFSDSSKSSFIRLIAYEPGSQSGLCGKEIHLEFESFNYTEEEIEEIGGLPEGMKVSDKCPGINVSTLDSECDSFHCYWNHERNQLYWWRL